MVVESRGQGTAIDKNKSPLRVRLVGQVNLGIGPPPIILLRETPHHLPGDALKRTELFFQVGQDLFMPVVALVADGYAGELFIDRYEAEAFDRDSVKHRRSIPQLVFVHMWACPCDFQVRSRGQGSTPGQVLKTIWIVHHRHRMGEYGAAHTQQESQQREVSARVISLPSDHDQNATMVDPMAQLPQFC